MSIKGKLNEFLVKIEIDLFTEISVFFNFVVNFGYIKMKDYMLIQYSIVIPNREIVI